MAKQYIPGISGLLTEPNPVDAPSNTLSEAENIIIDQNGKAQARHGLNINPDEATTPFTANSSEAIVAPNARTFVTPIADPDSTVSDSLLDYVHYSTFFNQDNIFFKLIEFRKSDDEVVSGLFVKQRKNEYITTTSGSNTDYLYKNQSSTANVNRYYQIASSSGKLVQMDELPYDNVKNVFATKLSLYLQTEDGIADTNVDDVFEPTSNRFFDIRWPAFPKISHTFTRSTIYANWLSANYKVGIRITFYREMGYTDKEEQIYESQPSPIYEIVNTGKDSIPVITLDLLASVDAQQLYEKWNEFSKLNNGRKFGIKIYRTKAVPVGQNLGVDFFECYESIRFDKALSGKLELSDASDKYEWFRFTSPGFSTSTSELLNLGDILSYIPTTTDENGNTIAIKYNSDRIKYYTNTSKLIDDMIPLKLKVTNRRKISGIYEYQFTVLNNSSNSFSPLLASAYLVKDSILSRRLATRLVSNSGSSNLQFINTLISLNGLTYYHILPISTLSNPSTIRFINTPPTPFLAGVDYHIVSNSWPDMRLSTTVGGTSIVATQSVSDFSDRLIEINPHPYIEQSYFIHSYELELNLNDEAMDDIGSPLYTNPNSDSAYYTNFIAPDSQFIAKYKDLYVHSAPKKPLEASISVINQPAIEQHQCIPVLSSAFYTNRTITFSTLTATFTSSSPTNIGLTNGNAVYFSSLPNGETTFKLNTIYYVINAAVYPGATFQLSATIGGTALTPSVNGTAIMQYQRWPDLTSYLIERNGIWTKSSTSFVLGNSNSTRQLNGELFLESAITGPRRYQISEFPTTSATSPLPGQNLISMTTLPDITNFVLTNTAKNTLNIDQYYLSENASFNLTMFERPYLTLKLTSLNDNVDQITIQTEPYYNRRGYYALKNEKDEFDEQYLTYDLSLDEMNSFRKSTNNTILQRGLDNIYHVVGQKEGQIDADGTYTASSEKWINDATGDVYYNKDANTLLIKNSGNFDIKKFESPGIIMIQSNQTDVILFSYSSIDISQATANSYTFKSVALQFISRSRVNETFIYNPDGLNQAIVANVNYFKVKGLTYFFFLKGTTVDSLDLYPYAKDIRIDSSEGITIQTATTGTTITEVYTPTNTTATNPTFTFLPHKKLSNIPVGTFNRNRKYTFLGLNSKDAGEYLDLYAWQIINKFNVELQKKNIKASLRKGPGIGEILINYPDGKIIEMMNGKYDSSSAANIYPGKHTFFPDLNKLEFTKLAEKEQYDLIENNQAYVSRRRIPEITPASSTITIGQSDKKMIGYGNNTDDLYIFKEDGIFRIVDSGDISSNIPNLQVFRFSANIVCQAAGSIQEINDEIIFLSQYGFISLSNGGIQNISGSIQRDILTLIQVSPKDRIRSFVNESKQLYYCTLINEVDPSLNVKSGTYMFNTKTRQWTFMDQEIIDGLEDSEKRNLVAYRQKAILGTSNGTSSWSADSRTHRLVSCDISYPMQTTDAVDNFYMISRERHTNNIIHNAQDQYDYMSENLIVSGSVFTEITNGFTITIPVSQNAFLFHYAQKLFKMFTPPTTINVTGNQYAIVDSPIQMLSNREIYAEMLRIGQTDNEYYQVKLTKFEYSGLTNYRIKYTFEYLTNRVPTTPISLQSLKLLAGIPTKLTFNPESGNSPDSNKLFQEYMIHMETVNKGVLMSFKTDSRSNFTDDRRFLYDPTATNRNVFRTYIPTKAARGRYLIRQVKHDVPLENLIITGQTVVMRDSGSTRVQKDKDEN